MPPFSRIATAAAIVLVATRAEAQHVTIPFLANAPQRGTIEFEGGECDPDRTGETLTCTFQQVFLTTDNAPPNTCMITTHAYDRVFRKDTPTRYVSSVGPEGVCGVVDVATLEDGGGVRWTLTLKKTALRKDAAAHCPSADETEVLSWQDVRRPLPCLYVQPGGLAR
ncbi:MAG TPA: hypothetical protein VFA59_09155 [Vicinamibacterales bacterium]|nr:hypothetical protein [Vicinamibacterales bacterium]